MSRTFRTSRRVRVGDCDSRGVVRIDALARYLQDVGYDDTHDIGVGDGGMWVARSISMKFPDVNLWPVRNEMLELETYCGGVGRAFAQRRVNITTSKNAVIETSTIWVSVNDEGKPAAVPAWLNEAYPQARNVSSKRELPINAPDAQTTQTINWPLRASDFDINDHANNSVAFDALYELAHAISAPAPSEILVEYHHPIGITDTTSLIYKVCDNGFDVWLMTDKNVAAAMHWMHERNT